VMASTHNVLVRAIRHAEADDHVGRNVASLVKPPQGKTGRPSRPMTAVEAAALLAAAQDHPRLGAYVLLSLTTRIRTDLTRTIVRVPGRYPQFAAEHDIEPEAAD